MQMNRRSVWITWLLCLSLLLTLGAAQGAGPFPPLPPVPSPPVLPDFRPDLTATVGGPAQLVAGQPFTDLVTITAANRGTESTDGGFMIDLKLRPGTGTRVLTIPLAQVPVEESLAVNESKTFAPAGIIPTDTATGTYCLQAVVDSDEVIDELNESNNTACHSIFIAGRDLKELSIALSAPTTLFQGQNLAAVAGVTVRNHGTAETLRNPEVDAYTIEVLLANPDFTPLNRGAEPDDSVPLFKTTITESLSAGAEREHAIEAALPNDVMPGAYCLLAIVDPDNTIAEANELNNFDCQQITIVEASAPTTPGPDPVSPLDPPVPSEDPPVDPPEDPPLAPPEEPPTEPPADPPTLPVDPPIADPLPPTFPTVCTAQRFSDLPITHRSCAAVSLLVSKGIVNGFPDGTFQPEQTVTRAEFAKMFVLTAGLTPRPTDPLPFSDTDGHWAAVQGFLQAAVANGAINGFPDGTFRPSDLVTRAQGVKIVNADELSIHEPYSDWLPSDVSSDLWYHPSVVAGVAKALMGPNSFYPLFTEAAFQGDTAMTRAEAALLLANRLVGNRE